MIQSLPKKKNEWNLPVETCRTPVTPGIIIGEGVVIEGEHSSNIELGPYPKTVPLFNKTKVELSVEWIDRVFGASNNGIGVSTSKGWLSASSSPHPIIVPFANMIIVKLELMK